MDFSKDQSDFLHKFQSLVFDKSLSEGTASQKADTLRSILAQLHYCKRAELSQEQTCSSVARDYEGKYADVVDSLDEQSGLNNYAEGALTLCSGHKNESQNWKTSLSSEKLRKMSCIQKLKDAHKIASDRLLPQDKMNSPLPFSANKENMNKPQTNENRDPYMRLPTKGTNSVADNSKVMNLYRNPGNNSRQVPDTQRDFGRGTTHQIPDTQRDFGRGTTHQGSAHSYNRTDRKPLFSNGVGSGNFSEQFSERSTSYGPASKTRGEQLKRPYREDQYDDEDKPNIPNAFKTAKEQLNIDQQKKYGGGNRGGSLSTSSYGVQKKSLGTRRGPSSRFVPPVMNREDSDGNEAANTITRAVLKTGGSGGAGKGEFSMEGLDAEKLKGIEPKMVELIMNEIMDNGHELTWNDIAGLEFAKKTIKEIVVWPMLRPDIFTGLRGPPKGLLLFGPPGTGKTLIGKCIASQSKSTFFCISASSLTSKWVGEGEKMVRALFAVARSQQPAVVFIDEIDSLLTQRTDGENEASRRIKTEFLVQLDGAGTSSDDRILIIGATNRPQEIDEAARRRFVKRLYIPLPELEARKTIILNLLRQQSYHLADDQITVICTRTDGFSGADMATLCREAALGPIRDMSFGDIENIAADQVRPIAYADFEDALEHVRPSVSEKDLDGYLDWNKTFGSGSR